MNRFLNHARWLISAARFGLALLLLATTAQAQIAVQDGLTALASSGAGPTVNKAFTVTPGASVLVVMLEDRQNAVILAEPATITWNGTNILTLDTNSLANASNYRSMAMYHLFNPPPGTGNITATYSAANNTIIMAAYTLSGVNTNIAPILLQANSTATTILSGTATGVAAGSWAAAGSIWGNTTALTGTGGTGGTATTVASTAFGGSSVNAGYVANLSAGTVTIGVTNGGSTKGCFIAEIFTPGAPSPAIIASQPKSLTVFTNTTVKLTVGANGATPLAYQWFTNNTTFPLSNGGNLTGTTNSVLTISNASLANAGNYFVVVTNLYGAATSSVANLTLTSPSGVYESAVMSNAPAPFAYYSFSETSDPSVGGVVAYDSIGAFNGTYGVASQNGFNSIVGPQSTADGLVGFPNGNTALGTAGANSQVTLPAFNLNNGVGTNVLTITAWIYPAGAQPNAAGVVFCRGGSTISGMAYLDGGIGTLGYNWNNEAGAYTWNSGLTPPANVWSLVALVITPTNATVYLCNTNSGLLSSTHVYNHVVQKFDAPTLIGFESYNASRVFNGSIDEVGLFGQALTPSQMATLFAAASGNPPIPPVIPTSPTWSPATVYVSQTASITVTAGGSTPLSYQWMAGAVGSGIYTNLANGGNISGATNPTLTITNVQDANYLDYVVRVSNAYGAVTSTVPATLTVTDPGPPTTFTLNYPGTPVQEGIGADWNNANVWSPLGLSAATSVIANPGSSFEVIVGSRLRNPTATINNVFPGTQLIVDGDGVFENGTVVGVGEIRFKNQAAGSSLAGGFYTTNYFPNLVLNGGQLNIGDNTTVVIKGQVTVATNSTLYAGGAGSTNQTFQIDANLTGSGTMRFYNINATNWDMVNSVLDITGTTNTFTGIWDIEIGQLVGNGINSLGTNTITINTNGTLETSYSINNPNSSLVLNGKVFLTQNDTFKSVYLRVRLKSHEN